MSRFIPKQFAENSTTSVVFGSFQEQGGNVGDGTISSDPATLQGGTAWPLGWSAATDNFFQIPRGEEMEGLERVLSAAIIQQFKDGLTFWQSEMPVTQYQTIVQYQTGSDHPKLYVNITGDSTSTPPDSDTTNWFMFCDTAQVLANVSLTNSPYTTNRILEIPQDIKFDLANNTLKLKAGSKLYRPNGFEADGITPHFDSIITENDLTASDPTANTSSGLMITNGTSLLGLLNFDACFSGDTAPTGTGALFWWDTANNIIKLSFNGGSTWDAGGYTLPPGIAHRTINVGYDRIDQTFNGFGYIGSTVFALPMKGQATTAINIDGTVTSTIWETTTVQTLTLSSSGSVSMSSTGVLTFGFNEVGYTKLVDVTYYSSRIQGVDFYGVSFVANSNASNFSQAGRSYLSGLGMPSGRYIDLTLGSSGAGYTATANGYFSLLKMATAAGQYVILNSFFGAQPAKLCTIAFAPNSNYGVGSFIPVRKGDQINISYTAAGALTYFRFVYAEGEN